MNRLRRRRAIAPRIRRLHPEFGTPQPNRLHQMGCCCCCCCIQVPVSTAAGMLAAPLFLPIGILPVQLRYRWAVVLRIVGCGLFMGFIQGAGALALWFQWGDHFSRYLAACIAGALLALLGLAAAHIADQPTRNLSSRPHALGFIPPWLADATLTIALGAALGSTLISAAHAEQDTPWPATIGLPSMLLAIILGTIVGGALVLSDQRATTLPYQPYRKSWIGALIGANLATVLAMVFVAFREYANDHAYLALSAAIIGGSSSTFIGLRKLRRPNVRAGRAACAAAVIADVFVLGTVAMLFTAVLIDEAGDVPISLTGGLVGFILGAILCAVSGPTGVAHPPRLEADADLVCPACTYDLRGITAERCPECGNTYDSHKLRAAITAEPFPIDALHPFSTSPILGAAIGMLIPAIFN